MYNMCMSCAENAPQHLPCLGSTAPTGGASCICLSTKVSCHRPISTGFLTDCTSQRHRLEYVLTPPSVSTDACAPCHRFKSFAAPSVFLYPLVPLRGGGGGGGGGGVRDECQISTGGVS